VAVEVALVVGTPCVAIVLAYSAPSVVFVVEPLPGVLAVAEEHLFAHVAVLDLVELGCKFIEVVADLPVDLATVYEYDELWLNPGIEVKLDFGLGVAVHADVAEVRELAAQAFVVFLDSVASRVPFGSEVQA